MTAQISDFITLDSGRYEIAGVRGDGLFSPEEFGLRPTMLSTACYRGYFCEYFCPERNLLLTQLTIRSDSPITKIAGLSPREDAVLKASVYDLELPISFSGGLLVLKDPVPGRVSRYISPSPPAFQVALELQFMEGELTSVSNLSSLLPGVRQAHDDFLQMMRRSDSRSADDYRKLDEISWSLSPSYRGSGEAHALPGKKGA